MMAKTECFRVRCIALFVLFFFLCSVFPQSQISAAEQQWPRQLGGNFRYQQQDIKIGLPGFDLSIVRTYNSQGRFQGIFGWGWTCEYDISVLSAGTPSQLFMREADGSVFMLRHDAIQRFYYSKRNGWQTLRQQQDGIYIRTLKGGHHQYFDAKGRLMVMTDLNGNRLSLAYSKEGKLTEVVSSTGRALRFGYDAKGRISRMEDPLGRVHSYLVDDSGNLAQAKDPQGRTTSFRYDQSHNLVEIRYPDGSSKKLTYDIAQDVLLREAGPGLGETTYRYEPGNRNIAVTDAAGNTSRITYSADGMTKELTDPLGGRSQFVYGEDGLLLSFQDAAGGKTAFEYDDRGLLKTATDPLGSTERLEYHPSFSLVTAYTNRAGGRYEFQYDQKGNLALITKPDGSRVQYQYTTQGSISERIGADGFRTRYSYDRNGYPVKESDDIGTLFEAAYDNAGQVVRGGMTGNPIYSFQYSPAGKVTQMTDSGRRLYRYTYNAMDRLVSISDPDKHETHITYDQAGRITAVQDALRHKTLFGYSASGRLVQLTDANGNVTRYRVDANGRIVEKEDAGGNRFRLSYDAAGNIASATDAKGQTVAFRRDRSGQVMERQYPDGSRVAFGYDPLGNITSVKEATGRMSFAYDKMGRIVSKQDERTGRMIAYAYDQNGRMIQKATSDGQIFRYGYDGRDRMTSIIDPLGGRTEYQYDGADRRSAIIYPNGTVARYVFDELGRFAEVRHEEANGKALARVVYTPDHRDRFASARINDGPARSYTYDAIGQFVRESVAGGETIAYRYDPMGNRLEAAGTETKKYIYDRLNRLIRAGETGYAYDANGHLVKKTERGSETRFTYDFEGRMTGVDLPGGQAYRYEYNAMGERVAWSGPDGRKLYLHDGEDVLAEFGGDRKLERLYVHGPGIDDIAGLIQGGSRFTVHADGAGSTLAVLDGQQDAVSRYEYGSFGQVKRITEKVVLPFLYTGARYDAESGLHYLRTRAYDPRIGRFVSPDTIDIAGDINLYRYVKNDPLNYTDPTGEKMPFVAAGAILSTSSATGRAVLKGGTKEEIGAAAAGGLVSGAASGAVLDLAVARSKRNNPAQTVMTWSLFVGWNMVSSGLGSFVGTATEQTIVNVSVKDQSLKDAIYNVKGSDLVISTAVSAATGGVSAGIGGASNLAFESNKDTAISVVTEIVDETTSTVGGDLWDNRQKKPQGTAPPERKPQETALKEGADYLNKAKEMIIASKASLSNVNQYAGVIDSLAAAANNASTQAQKAQGVVSSLKGSVNGARSACLNAPSLGEIKAARDVVVKAAAETQSLKERATKVAVKACSVADQRNREKDAVAKSKLDMEAKNLAIHAERNFGKPAHEAYRRAKENADKVLALEQKRAEAAGKAEAARSALDNAQIEVDVAVKTVRNAEDSLRNGLPTLNLTESAIQSGINSKNAALGFLNKISPETIAGLETGEKKGVLEQQKILIAQANAITFPSAETIRSKFNQAKGTLQRAKTAADQASSGLSQLKEALKSCEEVDSLADIVRDAMGAKDAAHRSLQITDNVVGKAKECAKLPQAAGKQESAKTGSRSTGQPAVTGKLPPEGADPFVGTWELKVTFFKHSDPDVPKVGGLSERAKMVINRSGNKYSVTGFLGIVDSVSVSGETITIKGRQSGWGNNYDLFTVQLTLKSGGSRLEGQMRWEYTSEIRPPGKPVQWSINSVVGTRQ